MNDAIYAQTKKLDAADQAKYDALRKLHLKLPKILPPAIRRILKKDYLSDTDTQAVRIEWHERFGGNPQ